MRHLLRNGKGDNKTVFIFFPPQVAVPFLDVQLVLEVHVVAGMPRPHGLFCANPGLDPVLALSGIPAGIVYMVGFRYA